METSQLPVKGCNLWPMFSMPHLLWHVTSVFNGHLRVPVTLTLIAEGLAVTICFKDLGLSRLGLEHPTFRLWGQRSNRLLHRSGERDMIQFIFVLDWYNNRLLNLKNSMRTSCNSLFFYSDVDHKLHVPLIVYSFISLE